MRGACASRAMFDTGGKRQAASGKRQAASGKRQAASGKRQAASGKRQAASGKRQAASSKQQAASSKQQAASSKQQAASSKQQAASSSRPAPVLMVRRRIERKHCGACPPRSTREPRTRASRCVVFPSRIPTLKPNVTMPEIVTLTPNPAIDVATCVERVTDTRKLRCGPARRDPGGGGINVARVLTRLGADCSAVYLAGGGTGLALRGLLADEGVRAHGIDIAGETRENFSVLETSTGREFRFVLPGPALAAHEWPRCVEALARLADASRYLVMSGSLPPGMPDDCYARLARRASARGVRTVVDTSGPALAAALDAGVYLVKPSLGELRALTGLPLEDDGARLAAARAIVAGGRAQIVALTLGDAGALVVSRDDAVRLPGVKVAVRSAIGAGDSFVAGLVAALNRGANVADAARHALAAASASLLSTGTALGTKEDIARIYRELPGMIDA
ncbi:1-phosphofructokinase family hexose kinase [Burkholderia pseudomallei]|nr:1-phosphofructokinase family hexose kinase [Burkholderia pseudomallei]